MVKSRFKLKLPARRKLGGIGYRRFAFGAARGHRDRGREAHRAPAGTAHSPSYLPTPRTRRVLPARTQLHDPHPVACRGDRDCLTELCARCTVGGALAKTPDPASAIPPPGSEPESPATVRPHRHRHTSDNTAHCTTPGHAFAPSASTAAGTPTPAIGDTLAPNLQTFFDSTSISRARFAHYDRCAPTEYVPRYVRPSHQAGDVSGSVP